MATYTSNLRLAKPDGSDPAYVSVLNANMDILDEAYTTITRVDVTILGTYQTLAELQSSVTNPNQGDVYQVGTDAPYRLYMYDDGEWGDIGRLQGESGCVWIKWSAEYPTQNSDMKSTPDEWIGIYSNDNANPPTSYSQYQWYQYKGDPGVNHRGAYSPSARYAYRDGVTYNNGFYYVSSMTSPPAGTVPTNTTYWTPIFDPTTLNAAEAARTSAETGRASAENTRVSRENARVSAENARATAETNRATAEATRATAETDRASAEQSRQAAEQSRVSVEQGRVTAEQSRATAEGSRATAESNRASAETGRATAETARVNAEQSRATAEQSRASAETGRANAETQRVTAETGRVNAETNRVNTEQGRVSAETARVNAENARASDTAAAIEDCEEATTAANNSVRYLHIRWGSSATPSSLLTTPAAYIGLANTQSPTAPTTYHGYQWYLYKGLTGDSGVYIGDTTPADPDIGVWVDTSDTEGMAATKISTTLTLAVANWSSTTKTQTVSVPGLLPPEVDDVIISPATASREAYNDAGVYCSVQAAGSLTFACDTVPSEALTVNLLIVR